MKFLMEISWAQKFANEINYGTQEPGEVHETIQVVSTCRRIATHLPQSTGQLCRYISTQGGWNYELRLSVHAHGHILKHYKL